ncbi:hypothetical protein Cgig2_016764 [Carnegiea gigantea]|uniref:Uncharacterized protein n=1 Tax=Carnegiea gigantea TaxID=171969 RepID=A0A9Q1JN95_9CARY|nr:hypothetical protein Cgig2_016764 [Carnegiea gigantea]
MFGLLELGDVVYPRLVRLFYGNLEIKFSAKGVLFESLGKSVKIILRRYVLESIFGLKFIDTAPPNLTQKIAKDLYLTQFASPKKIEAYKQQQKAPPYHVLFSKPRLLHYHVSDLTPQEASALKVTLPYPTSSLNVVEALAGLKRITLNFEHNLITFKWRWS